MKFSRLLCIIIAPLVVSCAQDEGPAAVVADWNLSCPDPDVVGCGSLATETCLGQGGRRTIAGADGDSSCDGEGSLVVACDALKWSDGRTSIALEATVEDFAFELDAILNGESLDDHCNVTIVEDGLDYGFGSCGTEELSMEQPCRLSNVSADGGEVAFELECAPVVSSVGVGFDLGAVGGGPTTIRFTNCDGL